MPDGKQMLGTLMHLALIIFPKGGDRLRPKPTTRLIVELKVSYTQNLKIGLCFVS